LIDFFLALELGKPFVDRLLARFGVKAQTIDSADRWMNSRGTWGVLIARFIPGLRSIISFPAGIFGMNPKPFFLMTLAGSFVWSTVLIYLGYSAGRL
jgi:membrane protein DedA with SNARE-associated domain